MKLRITAEPAATDIGPSEVWNGDIWDRPEERRIYLANFEMPHGRGATLYKVYVEYNDIPALIMSLTSALLRREKAETVAKQAAQAELRRAQSRLFTQARERMEQVG